MKVNNSKYNKRTTHTSKNSKVYNQPANILYLLPLIFITAILPLIMRFHEYDPGLSGFKWFSNEESWDDVFLYYKQIFFIIICSIMILLMLYKIFHDKMTAKFSLVLLPVLIYGLLALLSTIFSKYPSFGFTGIYEQFESIFVVLGYCLIVYYAFLFIKSEEDIRFVFHYLLIGVLIIGLLGLTQAVGHDFIGTNLGTKIVLPSGLWGKIGLNFNFGPNRVYLTLYNPNYVGVYVSLIIPILIGLLFSEKNRNKIILYVTALAGLLISVIGSQSKTSLISLCFAFALIVIFFRKYIFRKSKIMISIISVGILAVILLTAANFTKITGIINSVFNIQKTTPALTDIKTGDSLIMSYKENDLKLNIDNKDNKITISLVDAADNVVPYTFNNETSGFLISDPRFAGIQVTPTVYNEMLCIKVNIDGKDWIFSNQLGDNSFYFLNGKGKFDKIITADSALFTGYEKFASGRGYIWSRTIPLLKDHIFLGSGADSFVFTFPQQDYVNLYNAGFDGQLITRPHNLYLQMGVQYGVLALIAFLLFYAMYFVSSIKLFWKGTFQNFYYQAGVSIFIGTVAYMIAGITNDSTITVAPVFWVLIGIGVAINYKLKSMAKAGEA
ncbi:MAG: O-antigen ligase family protein [Anaerocolumna sp.]